MTLATLPQTPAADAASSPQDDGLHALHALLARLYREQMACEEPHTYLAAHAQPRSIDNHVRTFAWYRPFLPSDGNVLDWGCQHAPDSCLLRATHGDRFRLFSCDFGESRRHHIFHDFAASTHLTLDDAVRLPYPRETFDAVIGSGVLEHTARDGDSLSELYRVMKHDGVLVLTYLPNWLSINEWVRRVVRGRDFHRRLYGWAETSQLLKRHGFYPIAARYHTFLWERGRLPFSSILKRLLPVQVFSSTMCFIARKVHSM